MRMPLRTPKEGKAWFLSHTRIILPMDIVMSSFSQDRALCWQCFCSVLVVHYSLGSNCGYALKWVKGEMIGHKSELLKAKVFSC